MTKSPPAIDPLDGFEIDDDFLETISNLIAEDGAGDVAVTKVPAAQDAEPEPQNFLKSALSRVEESFSVSADSSEPLAGTSAEPLEASDMSALKYAANTSTYDEPVTTFELEDIEVVEVSQRTSPVQAASSVVDMPVTAAREEEARLSPFQSEAVPEVAPSTMPVLAGVGGLDFDAQAVDVSIPRIAVHIFAERQDTLAAAERAAQDRRMSRATHRCASAESLRRSRPISTNRPRR
ncbi:hypothetical protein [Brevundimonas sp.]|uniref:hypothetical protein n=1 Tax=Brevundimonas sp. TaxID=1871086 RepID=UPI003FA5ACD0